MRNTMKNRAEKVLRLLEARWQTAHSQKMRAEERGDEVNRERYLFASGEIAGAELLLRAIIENDTEYIDEMCRIYGIK